jgi:hypothetical protein
MKKNQDCQGIYRVCPVSGRRKRGVAGPCLQADGGPWTKGYSKFDIRKIFGKYLTFFQERNILPLYAQKSKEDRGF